MTIRDIGYKPYVGSRLNPDRTLWVIFRGGVDRAFASWLVRLVLFFGWIPAAIAALGVGFFAKSQEGGAPQLFNIFPADFVSRMLGFQFWSAALLISLAIGATTIAEDLSTRSLHVYFSKPVTPLHYLIAKTLAVSTLIFAFLFFPAALLVVAFAYRADTSLIVEMLGLIFPCAAWSIAATVTLSVLSVAISSFSRSRAVTMTTWAFVVAIPAAVGLFVDAIDGSKYVGYVAITKLLDSLKSWLFNIDDSSALPAWSALLILVTLCVGAFVFALKKLRSPEAIA